MDELVIEVTLSGSFEKHKEIMVKIPNEFHEIGFLKKDACSDSRVRKELKTDLLTYELKYFC